MIREFVTCKKCSCVTDVHTCYVCDGDTVVVAWEDGEPVGTMPCPECNGLGKRFFCGACEEYVD